MILKKVIVVIGLLVFLDCRDKGDSYPFNLAVYSDLCGFEFRVYKVCNCEKTLSVMYRECKEKSLDGVSDCEEILSDYYNYCEDVLVGRYDGCDGFRKIYGEQQIGLLMEGRYFFVVEIEGRKIKKEFEKKTNRRVLIFVRDDMVIEIYN